MNDLDRIRDLFSSGALLRPDDAPNLVDLARALAHLGGADVAIDPNVTGIAAKVGRADQLVFALVDGLGMNGVESLPDRAFHRSHLAMELRSIFPSSTAPALTTLGTGLWPGQHAVPAWWTHLPRAGLTATILQFTERFEGKALPLSPAELFPAPTLLPRLRADVRSFQPQPITDSPYARYLRGTTPATGYGTLAEGVDAVVRRVETAIQPTYTYLYWPALDKVEHQCGPQSPEARTQLDLIDRELGRLADGIRDRGRLVVSADHGLMEVSDDSKAFLAPDDPLLRHLTAPPAGEPRIVMFHPKRDGFAEEFRGRFGDRFALLSIGEAESLGLFGPAPIAPEAKSRIGEFLAIATEPATLFYGPPRFHREEAAMRGFHGGLTPEEMRVPLVVA